MAIKKLKHPEYVRIRTQIIREFTAEEKSRMNTPLLRAFRKSGKKGSTAKPFMPNVLAIKTAEVETIDSIAFQVRKMWGFGEFNILIFNWYKKNKYFEKNSNCHKKLVTLRNGRNVRCNYLVGKRQNARGYKCFKHRRTIKAYERVATITIREIENPTNDCDYNYIWHNNRDKMRKFRRWFWMEK